MSAEQNFERVQTPEWLINENHRLFPNTEDPRTITPDDKIRRIEKIASIIRLSFKTVHDGIREKTRQIEDDGTVSMKSMLDWDSVQNAIQRIEEEERTTKERGSAAA